MAQSNSNAHHRALAAFVTEHRELLEDYAGSDKQSASLAKAVLAWERADRRDQKGASR